MNSPLRSRLDELLDLLADEVAARLRARTNGEPNAEPAPSEPPPPEDLKTETISPAEPIAEPETATSSAPQTDSAPIEQTAEPAPSEAVTQIHTGPIALPTSNNTLLLKRFALLVFALVVLINIPLNAQGVALARVFPNSASLSLEDGLLVKESDSPDVYVYWKNAFHWVTSLEAFQYYRYRWQDVHIVEPGYLTHYPKGDPIYLLYKCDASPHVFAYDGKQRHWIIDIPSFVAQGFVWDQVQIVDCPYLRNLPDGESIPPGHGTPPPPRP